ncbi:MAG: DUF364 domain-containing protein [Bacteroidales bacterium]
MIIDQTYNLLKTDYREKTEDLTIKDVIIGLHLTAVRLSDDSFGVASTLTDDHPNCAKESRDYGDFSPSKIKGQRISYLFETLNGSSVVFTLKIAVLNAISSGLISSGKYTVFKNCDPVDLIDLSSRKTITIVGAFHSYIRKISETNNRLYVLELNKNALYPDEMQFYIPAVEYPKVFQGSDVVIITGLTLVNNSIDNLLSAIPQKARVIVTGPSSSIIPDILFANNVEIIGATHITKPDVLFDIVSEAGAGFHLFRYCAQKICILKRNEKQGI